MHQLGDEGWANVPLPFNFPFYGQSFNESTMYSNGAVQFGRPVPAGGWPNWNNAFCCQGIQLNSGVPSGYNHSILALQTDLAGWEGANHYTLGTANTMTYGWYGVSQYGNNDNRSTFELKINSSGGIDLRWSGAKVTYSPVSIGTIGNAALGEFTQNYYNSSGIEITSLTQLSTGPMDPCIISPLSSPSCAGYAVAYLSQQCTINPLYDPTCPGYQQAYFEQQCYINPLYSVMCLGYEDAFRKKIALETARNTEASAAVTVATVIAEPALVSDPVVNVVIAAPAPTTAQSVSPVSTLALARQVSENREQSTREPARENNRDSSKENKSQTAKPTQKPMVAGGVVAKEEKENNNKNAAFDAANVVKGFDVYSSVMLRDVAFYKPFEIYRVQQAVDNRRALRGLTAASEQRYDTMINEQYK